MTPDPFLYLVIAVAVTILGLSKGGFAGIGMVSTPMVAAVTDPVTAVGLMLPIMLVQDPVAVFLYRKEFDRGILLTMIPGGLIGVLAAYQFAALAPDWSAKLALGLVSLAFSLWQGVVLLRGLPRIATRYRYDRTLGVAAGAAGGFASAIAHAGSPPFQIYVMPRQLHKEVYVGTSVMFFASVNLMKLPSFAALGLFTRDALATSAIFMPLAILASWAGARLVRRVDVRRFNLIITAILFAIGLILIAQALREAT